MTASTASWCAGLLAGRGRRTAREPRTLIALVLLVGCVAESPPATEQDVLAGLATDLLLPMGDVRVAGWPSDCRTDGVTDAPVAAALFTAFLDANAGAAPVSLAFGGPAARLRVDSSGQHPRRLSAEGAEPVVAVSHAGMVDDTALVCVEVFGVQERAFLVLLNSGPSGDFAVQSEIEVWSELAPEELPDGELYR
ncbi:MAG: hypothetical protein OXG82_13670 [Gammaproteobacteria bacterium]|nr:hypothetical protein [Gammaproteobacteria bacterium]